MDREDLVLVYTARDEQEGRMLSEWLRSQGVEVYYREPRGSAYDGLESVWMGRHLHGLYVLERLAETAKGMVAEYMAAMSAPAEGAPDEGE